MDSPLPRYPLSLDLLRGFESAARHGSFTKAAAELFLTQSAVSRQVQSLEAQLGVPLFERRHREIRLTGAGQRLFRAATEALRIVADAAAELRPSEPQHRTITVSCTVGFASLWLVPRLLDFQAQHPEVDIRIAAENRLIDIERERIEVAIRYGPPSLAPAGATRLFGEEVFPVCSPALSARAPLAQPADLARHVLLHYDWADGRGVAGSWPFWLEAVGLPRLRGAGSLSFNQYDQMIHAAVEGQGVALGIRALVSRHLAAGRLVAPFEARHATPRGYYLIVATSAAGRADVQAFVDWLGGAAASDAQST